MHGRCVSSSRIDFYTNDGAVDRLECPLERPQKCVKKHSSIVWLDLVTSAPFSLLLQLDVLVLLFALAQQRGKIIRVRYKLVHI